MSLSTRLDLKNRKILYELDKNSRQTHQQIGKKVGLSGQGVGKRIKNLSKLKVIDYFYVKTNPSTLGYTHLKIYIRFHNLSLEQEKKIIDNLKRKKNVFWISVLRGKYDIVISIYLKNIACFSKIYNHIFAQCKPYILEKNVIVLEKASTYTKSFLIKGKEPQEIIYSDENQILTRIDSIDKKILKHLSKDAKATLLKIAQKVKVSVDCVNYRIKQLKKKGIITGFGTKINFELLDHNYYIITLKLQEMNAKKEETLKEIAKQNKNVIIYIKTIGEHDVELEVETTKKGELDHLLKQLRNTLAKQIKSYEILEVTKEHTINYYPF